LRSSCETPGIFTFKKNNIMMFSDHDGSQLESSSDTSGGTVVKGERKTPEEIFAEDAR
jgi:hypothetical protein